MAEALPLQPGDPHRIGGYEITGRLGVGEQGAVFRGRSPAGGSVAVKILHLRLSGEPAARSRFAGAFEAARRVSGFCTAGIIDADVESDRPYVVTEFVDGPSLQQLVLDEGPRGAAVTERLAVGIAIALAAIHRAGAVHHDFKPGNVLLGRDGPRVTDFGVARALEEVAAAPTGRVSDDPAYKAPEQLRGVNIGPGADVFAWGATVLFAATGQAPFGDDTPSEVMQRIVYDDPDLTPVPDTLREVVADALAKDPEDRPTSAELLGRLLAEEAPLAARLPQPMVAEGRALASGSVPDLEVTTPEAPKALPVSAPAPVPASAEPPADVSDQSTQMIPAMPLAAPAPPPPGGPAVPQGPGAPFGPRPGPFGQQPGPFGQQPARDEPRDDSRHERQPHLIPGMDTGAQQHLHEDGGHGHTAVLEVPKKPRIPWPSGIRRPDNHVLGVAASVAIGVIVGIAIIALVLGPQLKGGSDDTPKGPGPSNVANDTPVTAIPEAFAGTWRGTAVNAKNHASFPIEVTFQVGSKVAQARYPRNNCVGSLALNSGTTRKLQMSLTIGQPCHNGTVQVVKQPDGSLNYAWTAPSNPAGYQGKLTKG
jgi:serine/threonine protein kinase